VNADVTENQLEERARTSLERSLLIKIRYKVKVVLGAMALVAIVIAGTLFFFCLTEDQSAAGERIAWGDYEIDLQDAIFSLAIYPSLGAAGETYYLILRDELILDVYHEIDRRGEGKDIESNLQGGTFTIAKNSHDSRILHADESRALEDAVSNLVLKPSTKEYDALGSWAIRLYYDEKTYMGDVWDLDNIELQQFLDILLDLSPLDVELQGFS